jgi:hypothetical protein
MCSDILGFLWKDFWKWDSQRREVVLNQADPLLLYQSEFGKSREIQDMKKKKFYKVTRNIGYEKRKKKTFIK